MKNFKKIVLVIVIISSMAFAMEKAPQLQLWQGPQPTFAGIPKEVQAIIMSYIKQSIVADNLDQTVKNITNFSLVNKDFRTFLNLPTNIKWLITTIAKKTKNRWLDSLLVAESFKNMPGMQNPEIKKWINGLKLINKIDRGNIVEINTLLQAGADVNVIETRKDGTLHTPLTRAVSSIHKIEILQTLLKAGADINALNGKALMIVAEYTDHEALEAARELLKHNPILTFTNKQGQTALDIAVKNGNEEIANLIRAKEAEYKETK
jgi:ankyrin repeat protein